MKTNKKVMLSIALLMVNSAAFASESLKDRAKKAAANALSKVPMPSMPTVAGTKQAISNGVSSAATFVKANAPTVAGTKKAVVDGASKFANAVADTVKAHPVVTGAVIAGTAAVAGIAGTQKGRDAVKAVKDTVVSGVSSAASAVYNRMPAMPTLRRSTSASVAVQDSQAQDAQAQDANLQDAQTEGQAVDGQEVVDQGVSADAQTGAVVTPVADRSRAVTPTQLAPMVRVVDENAQVDAVVTPVTAQNALIEEETIRQRFAAAGREAAAQAAAMQNQVAAQVTAAPIQEVEQAPAQNQEGEQVAAPIQEVTSAKAKKQGPAPLTPKPVTQKTVSRVSAIANTISGGLVGTSRANQEKAQRIELARQEEAQRIELARQEEVARVAREQAFINDAVNVLDQAATSVLKGMFITYTSSINFFGKTYFTQQGSTVRLKQSALEDLFTESNFPVGYSGVSAAIINQVNYLLKLSAVKALNLTKNSVEYAEFLDSEIGRVRSELQS